MVKLPCSLIMMCLGNSTMNVMCLIRSEKATTVSIDHLMNVSENVSAIGSISFYIPDDSL